MSNFVPPLIGRRKFLEYAGKGALALGLRRAALPLIATGCGLDIEAIGETPLGERAEKKGLLFGTAVRHGSLDNLKYRDAIAADCNVVFPETQLFWRHLEIAPGFLNFRDADIVAEFAHANNIAFMGNTVLWYFSPPSWLREFLADETKDPRNLLIKHVRDVVGHYAGNTHSWIVVNEPIHPPHLRADGLRVSSMLNAIGPEYIELAYRTAAEADPDALLVLNELGLHTDRPYSDKKRRHLLILLEGLLKKDVPLHALGLQGHLYPGKEDALNLSAFRRFCRDVADLGLKIMVTELDVRDSKIPGTIEQRDVAVADAYRAYLDVVLEQPATISVLTWGLSDKYSWLQNHFPRADGQMVRSTPYDSEIEKKLAWYAIASAIDNAAPRPTPDP